MQQNIPETLNQVLQVYRLVRKSRFERIKAMHEVANKKRTSYQVIASACTRGLAIRHMAKLDDFLLPKNTNAFQLRLIQHFPGCQSFIEEFFEEFKEGKDTLYKGDPVSALLPEEAKNILNILLLREIMQNVSLWMNRNDVPADIKQELRNLHDQISKRTS